MLLIACTLHRTYKNFTPTWPVSSKEMKNSCDHSPYPCVPVFKNSLRRSLVVSIFCIRKIYVVFWMLFVSVFENNEVYLADMFRYIKLTCIQYDAKTLACSFFFLTGSGSQPGSYLTLTGVRSRTQDGRNANLHAQYSVCEVVFGAGAKVPLLYYVINWYNGWTFFISQ
jgi:hypothetical protein